MSKQVLSIEQMKHLQELGLDISKASMMYVEIDKEVICANKNITYLLKGCEYGKVFIDVFTLQDILDLLPDNIVSDKFENDLMIVNMYNNWSVFYSFSNEFDSLKCFRSRELIDAAYEMLCWCIKNKYIKQ